jgi:rhamnose transport system permease protein
MRLIARREVPPLVALLALLGALSAVAPTFFSAANLRDLILNNAPALIVATGMTLVILAGEIDVSVASMFAVCRVVGAWLAKSGVPLPLLPVIVVISGALLGAFNGLLIGRAGLPSIIVTLAMLVAWRDGLEWITGGAWVQDLPANFQWFGLDAGVAQLIIVLVAGAVVVAAAWILRNLSMGRALYAVGCEAEAARLAGIDPRRVRVTVFVITGALVGLAAMLNDIRFTAVPSNAGAGLELKAIAAVVVGGTSIAGGRGGMLGTLVGVALLGVIGPALAFMGVSPFWEKAIQGAIILAALASDAMRLRLTRSAHVRLGHLASVR